MSWDSCAIAFQTWALVCDENLAAQYSNGDVIMKQLKRHLSWLTRDVAVVELDDYGSFRTPKLTIDEVK